MIIWGFDPSKSSGFAIYDTTRDRAAIVCGTFEMPKGADHYYTPEQIGQKVLKMRRDHGKPDFVVLEEQIAASVKGTNADGMLYPWLASSAIVATLGNLGVPSGTLTSGKWRKAFFGEGYKPPQKLVSQNGKKTLKNDWKSPAIARCEDMGVVLPSTKALADDAAEAVAIALCWRHKEMHFHAKRHYEPWIHLVQQRDSYSTQIQEVAA